MKRFWRWKDRGYVLSGHPGRSGLPALWSLKPEDVHSLVWWSKDYRYFMKDARRAELSQYRNFFNMTICGDRTTELGVPELAVQLQSMADLVAAYGPEKVQWRYSPIPYDWNRFTEIAKFVAGLGLTECYFSFLHSETPVPETRTEAERREILIRMAGILQPLGMDLLGCWDDDMFRGVCSNVKGATCLDAHRINRIYGLEKYNLTHPKEPGCRCTKSIDIGNQKLLPCPHNCTFCYAAPDNQ
tara:strand:- start:11309 stop:12037 length:729 start_codon:yes stop_codon:yes gene_type:complete